MNIIFGLKGGDDCDKEIFGTIFKLFGFALFNGKHYCSFFSTCFSCRGSRFGARVDAYHWLRLPTNHA
jgi:hypothetical protein